MKQKRFVGISYLLICFFYIFAIDVSAGNITYTLSKTSNPTADQSDAYKKITAALDSAVYYYNRYSSVEKKLTIQYEPSVATADGNSNGNIRFGKNRSYMVVCTAMHEIAHVLGIGTTDVYKKLIINKVYTGKKATEMLKEVTGDSNAVLKGDAQHFWPYGLNYSSEVKSTQDFINHVKIVNAMQMDFYPGITSISQFDINNPLLTRAKEMTAAGQIVRFNISGQKIKAPSQNTGSQIMLQINRTPKTMIHFK